ncbi:hypothetical protein BGW38_000144 [Lunasporangiospora selenospora]|uniref:Uncharacterized protein n=1 Tax=Lunasporangiospora selenospora TaxID=979761 RepID=A0A9P6KF66_9FUNG|nr:hypothetical protein BGW38_000144 [Lunasporangiospora selenospora]
MSSSPPPSNAPPRSGRALATTSAGTALKDSPSPETFGALDMTGSYSSYLCPNSSVPMGIRQAIGDADKLFKFQFPNAAGGAGSGDGGREEGGLYEAQREQFLQQQQQKQHQQQQP